MWLLLAAAGSLRDSASRPQALPDSLGGRPCCLLASLFALGATSTSAALSYQGHWESAMPAPQKPEKPEPNSHVTKWCKCIGTPQALVRHQHDLHLIASSDDAVLQL